jgi:hypothetical protein
MITPTKTATTEAQAMLPERDRFSGFQCMALRVWLIADARVQQGV